MSSWAEKIAGARVPHFDPEVRAARMRGHKALDDFQFFIYGLRGTDRASAYRWLSEAMGVDAFHFGESDVETCERAIQLLDGAVLSWSEHYDEHGIIL